MRVAATWLVGLLVVLLAGVSCPGPGDDGGDDGGGLAVGTLRGTAVLEAGGDPAVGAQVQVYGTSFFTTADADGVFTIEQLPSGAHRLIVTLDADANGVAERRADLREVMLLDDAGVDLGEVVVALVGSVTGSVDIGGGALTSSSQAQTGDPVPVTVAVQGTDRSTTVAADPDADYSLDGLAAGSYTVVAAADGYAPQTVQVTVSSGSETSADALSLAPNSGDFDGSLSLAATLVGQSQHDGIVFATLSPYPLTATSDSDGSATLDLPPGLYSLKVSKEGYVPTFIPNLGVLASGTTDADRVLLFATVGGPVSCDLSGEGSDGDGDGDGVADNQEPPGCRCNPYSVMDYDGDTICDPLAGDLDGDGVLNARDNCPLAANADQADRDNNGEGDACYDGCGDGDIDDGELCDDGNFDDGDGCDTSCLPELPIAIALQPAADWSTADQDPGTCGVVNPVISSGYPQDVTAATGDGDAAGVESAAASSTWDCCLCAWSWRRFPVPRMRPDTVSIRFWLDSWYTGSFSSTTFEITLWDGYSEVGHKAYTPFPGRNNNCNNNAIAITDAAFNTVALTDVTSAVFDTVEIRLGHYACLNGVDPASTTTVAGVSLEQTPLR